MLTQEYLCSIFSYDRETGVVTSKVPRGNGGRWPAGSIVGTISSTRSPCLETYVCGRIHKLHRLIYIMETGREPRIIKHLDDDGTNNKWKNLDERASKAVNVRKPFVDVDPHQILSYADAHRLFTYNPDTGVLVNKVDRNSNAMAGDEVGSPKDGYLAVNIGGMSYLVHRIIWLMWYGVWPECLLDHRDLDRSNNRIGNLRAASYAQNCHNRPKASNNTTGYKGVTVTANGRFQAAIGAKRESLGTFATPEEAHAAYAQAAQARYGEFARW